MDKPEARTQSPEERLIAAGEELGKVLQRLTDEQRAVVRAIKQSVEQEFEEQRKQGAYMDRSAFFAAALIGHPDLEDDDLVRAASNYVDADLAYVRWQDDQEGGEPS